jgi:hypothetical protein
MVLRVDRCPRLQKGPLVADLKRCEVLKEAAVCIAASGVTHSFSTA